MSIGSQLMVIKMLKCIWKCKESKIDMATLKKILEVIGLVLPDHNTYYQTTVIKTVKFGYTNRQVNQQNNRESSVTHQIHLVICLMRGITQWSGRRLCL